MVLVDNNSLKKREYSIVNEPPSNSALPFCLTASIGVPVTAGNVMHTTANAAVNSAVSCGSLLTNRAANYFTSPIAIAA